jgi:hypothetical protein
MSPVAVVTVACGSGGVTTGLVIDLSSLQAAAITIAPTSATNFVLCIFAPVC